MAGPKRRTIPAILKQVSRKLRPDSVSGFLANFRVAVPVGLIVFSTAVVWVLTVNKPPLAKKKEELVRLPVHAMIAEPEDVAIQLRSYGNVMPYKQTELSAEVAGNVVSVLPQFLVGSFFNRGDILLRIDDRDYEADLKQAESVVARARSKLALEESRSNSALQDWLALHPGRTAVDANALTLRKPQLEEARAELESALANRSKMQSNLERTVIRAPYNGLVRTRLVDEGQFVSRGGVLGLIYATDYAEIRLPIPEKQLEYLDLPDGRTDGHPLVSLGASVGDTTYYWYGRIVRAENVLDERSRNFFVVAMVSDPYGLGLLPKARSSYVPLRYGVFVNAVIRGRTLENLLVLPRNLLNTDNTVWVIENQLLRERTVKVLQTDGSEIYVYEGIAAGEMVNMSPLGSILPGTAVEVVEQVQGGQQAPLDISEERAHQNSLPNGHAMGDARELIRSPEDAPGKEVEMERLQ